MEKLYAELAEYFVFDKQKYSLEEFFSDIKTFKDQFKQAYDSIIKERESEAKLIRAREEREKAEGVSFLLFSIAVFVWEISFQFQINFSFAA